MQLKDIFSKYEFSDSKKLADLSILIRHRGLPNNEKIIQGSKIKVHRAYFEYFNGIEWVHIPFHRILEIKDKNKGKIIYKKVKKH